jgi:hypothetical protein
VICGSEIIWRGFKKYKKEIHISSSCNSSIINDCLIAVGVGDVVECAASLIT